MRGGQKCSDPELRLFYHSHDEDDVMMVLMKVLTQVQRLTTQSDQKLQLISRKHKFVLHLLTLHQNLTEERGTCARTAVPQDAAVKISWSIRGTVPCGSV